jgi:SAM-dependent methyltransferase
MVSAAAGNPILDVACGAGRNALFLARNGSKVVCLDKDLVKLRTELLRLGRRKEELTARRMVLQTIDLLRDGWPFGAGSAGGIINVHFFSLSLLSFFESTLMPGGYLLLETIPGCGGNWVSLPKSGEVRAALERSFEFEFYRETKIGPRRAGSVTVGLFAKRRLEPSSNLISGENYE